MLDPNRIRLGPVSMDVEFGILLGPAGRSLVAGDAARLLPAMMSKPGHVFSLAALFDICTLSPTSHASVEKVVRERMASCRGVLKRVGAADMLKAERGIGYVMHSPLAGRRLNEHQSALLDALLASHPDEPAVAQFRIAEFYRSDRVTAAERAAQGANGICLTGQVTA